MSYINYNENDDDPMINWMEKTIKKKSIRQMARILVPNKSHNEIYQKYIKIGNNCRDLLVQHVFTSDANDMMKNGTFDYIPMTDQMHRILENPKYQNKKEREMDRLKEMRSRRNREPTEPPSTPTTSKYAPSTPLSMHLRTAKGPLTPINGYGIINFKFIEMYRYFITELQSKVTNDPSQRDCKCDPPELGAYNMKSKAMTTSVEICCKCGVFYVTFYFGEKVEIDNKLYYENAIRFVHLTGRIKERFALAEKMQLIFGIQAPDRRTYNKYKKVTVNKTKEIAQESMDEVIVTEIAAKERLGRETVGGGDASWLTKGYRSKYGQFGITVRTDTIDPVTGKNWKIAAAHVMKKGLNHEGSSGSMEVKGMEHCLRKMHGKGLSMDKLTKDCDSASRKKIAELNDELGTNTQKRNDMNHTTNAAINRRLNYTNKATGYEWWKVLKALNPEWTQPVHAQFVSIMHKRLHGIANGRKDAIESGQEQLNLAFFEDFRLRICGSLIHFCWGHGKCKENKYSKEFCRNIDDPEYLPKGLTTKKGVRLAYPSSKAVYDFVHDHFMKVFDDNGITDLLDAFHTNSSESYNGRIASMLDKSKFINFDEYEGYVHTGIGLTNIGEEALTLEEDKRLGLDTNDKQKEIATKRMRKRKEKREYERSDGAKRKRIKRRHNKNKCVDDKLYDNCNHIFDYLVFNKSLR